MENNKIKKQAKARTITRKSIITLIIWFFGIMMFVPFLWMISSSFKSTEAVFTYPIEWIPSNPTLHAYKKVLGGKVPFLRFYLNSIKVTGIAMVGTFFSCTMAGFAYAKLRFVGRDKLFLLKLMTTMIPGMVTLMPTFLLYSKLGLVDTHAALYLGYFLGGTYGVFLMRQAFMSLPGDLLDAAKIDGASYPRTYWSIALPNVKASWTTLLFLYFIWSWNNYEGPLLYLRTPAKYTLPFAVKYLSDQYSQDTAAIMAANVLMLLPIMILFFVAQKSFVQSLVSSGIKG